MQYDKRDLRPADILYPHGAPGGIGIDRRAAVALKVCMKCAGEAEFFADHLSEEEFKLTGLCQKCQDGMYEMLAEMEEDG